MLVKYLCRSHVGNDALRLAIDACVESAVELSLGQDICPICPTELMLPAAGAIDKQAYRVMAHSLSMKDSCYSFSGAWRVAPRPFWLSAPCGALSSSRHRCSHAVLSRTATPYDLWLTPSFHILLKSSQLIKRCKLQRLPDSHHEYATHFDLLLRPSPHCRKSDSSEEQHGTKV